MAKSSKTAKQVQVIARVEFKSDTRKVIYLVRASNGVDQYQVSLFDGQVSGCSCAARKPCYHMKGVQAKENARVVITVGDRKVSGVTPAHAVKKALRLVRPVVVSQVSSECPVEDKPTTCPPCLPVAPVPTAERGALNGSRGFSLLKVG